MQGWLAPITPYLHRRVIAMLFLGFSSGLPLALTASTLGIWLTEAGVTKATIGLFASAATPYAFKFLWAPLLDGLKLPGLTAWFGRRRGWMLLTQLALAAALVGLSFANPTEEAWQATYFLALLVVIASASQDIVIDAYRVESLPADYQGAGAGAAVLGYRFGMIMASAGALFLAEAQGWQFTYIAMAALMAVGVITTLLVAEPELSETESRPRSDNWLAEYVVAPFVNFMAQKHWLAMLLFIMLYKFSDAFMGVMTNPFLIELGFTKPQIATVVKLFGLWATIAGSIIGGMLVFRLGLWKSLWVCGILQMVTNLAFVGQAWAGADARFLALAITLENMSGGMGTAAFVAFISGLCNKHFTATQYALLSSVAAFGRTWLSTPAGKVAELLGWPAFFIFSTLLAVPGLVLLAWLQRKKIA